MKAKDIMRKSVVTVKSYLTVSELAQIFTERCISGAPVVDQSGQVVGVVSQTDLVNARSGQSSAVPLFHAAEDEPTTAVGMHYEVMDSTRVEEIMTPGAISYDEETPVAELARAMTERHIHRVLITRKGRLIGIVTTMDMIQALLPSLKRKKPAARPTRKHGRLGTRERRAVAMRR
ncbi:MAG: CBS domain-containing protein [Elusimicrobiota bacterium]